MRAAFCLLLMLLGWPHAVRAEGTDLALVLLADATGSIDENEIRFQREGWARAITEPAILEAISVSGEGRIALTYVEWGGDGSQAVIVPWSIIDGQTSAQAFARALRERPRQAFGPNAIGSAIDFATNLLLAPGVATGRRVIDLSGDSSYSFSGVPLDQARDRAIRSGITINGLALFCPALGCNGRPGNDDVEGEFARKIIGGPGAFVLTADNETSFADAARRKLLLEIAGAPVLRQLARSSHR